jgi:hypothetical protein
MPDRTYVRACVCAKVMNFKDTLTDARCKWEVHYFWMFGLLLIYYM